MLNVYVFSAVLSSIVIDESRVLEIKADGASFDTVSKQSVWTGNIALSEGPYFLTADTVSVEHNDLGHPCKVYAQGSPVLATGPINGDLGTATGKVMIYDCEASTLELSDRAELRTDDSRLKSNRIIYDFIAKTLLAEGLPGRPIELQANPTVEIEK